jgi:hypothetical protein
MADNTHGQKRKKQDDELLIEGDSLGLPPPKGIYWVTKESYVHGMMIKPPIDPMYFCLKICPSHGSDEPCPDYGWPCDYRHPPHESLMCFRFNPGCNRAHPWFNDEFWDEPDGQLKINYEPTDRTIDEYFSRLA